MRTDDPRDSMQDPTSEAAVIGRVRRKELALHLCQEGTTQAPLEPDADEASPQIGPIQEVEALLAVESCDGPAGPHEECRMTAGDHCAGGVVHVERPVAPVRFCM